MEPKTHPPMDTVFEQKIAQIIMQNASYHPTHTHNWFRIFTLTLLVSAILVTVGIGAFLSSQSTNYNLKNHIKIVKTAQNKR